MKVVILAVGFVFLSFPALAGDAPPWVPEAHAESKSYVASIAIMSHSSKEGEISGAFYDLIRALDRVTNTQTEIMWAPFKRSVRNLIEGKVDYHIPIIEAPNAKSEELPYDFSTATLFKVAFVLYTNKNISFDINDIEKYVIGTDSAHTDFFPFPTEGYSCLECAIKMVNIGRIDGFIFAQNEIDPFIVQYGLTNIRRQLYKVFLVKAIIPKGEVGKETDRHLSEGIRLLNESGEYQKILKPVLVPYQDWQP